MNLEKPIFDVCNREYFVGGVFVKVGNEQIKIFIVMSFLIAVKSKLIECIRNY